jgi:hypothetical protein
MGAQLGDAVVQVWGLVGTVPPTTRTPQMREERHDGVQLLTGWKHPKPPRCTIHRIYPMRPVPLPATRGRNSCRRGTSEHVLDCFKRPTTPIYVFLN